MIYVPDTNELPRPQRIEGLRPEVRVVPVQTQLTVVHVVDFYRDDKWRGVTAWRRPAR